MILSIARADLLALQPQNMQTCIFWASRIRPMQFKDRLKEISNEPFELQCNIFATMNLLPPNPDQGVQNLTSSVLMYEQAREKT